jgi:erythromycin esterase
MDRRSRSSVLEIRRRTILALAVVGAACLDVPSEPVETTPPDAVTAWFMENGRVIESTSPSSDDADIVRLVGMVGNARLIGAGEATHGTRQFFEMKHRLLQSLVLRRAGVSAFAIEASMPDAMDIDRYVRTGEGDPSRVLSHLYFWTWRTQEVLDLIRWLRQYNTTVAANQRIGFYGVDMQYPGGAIRRVSAWIPAQLASLRTEVANAYSCAMPFINDDQGVFARNLETEPQSTRDACLAGARAAVAAITARSADLRPLVGDDSYETHLQLAVTVVQWATRVAGQGGIQYRDFAMAENARWLLRRTSGRVFLWAHNGHITRASGTMGKSLADSLGTNYFNVGFTFDSGTFNARPSVTESPQPLRAGPAAENTYEAFFRRFRSTFYFDVRGATGFAVRSFLVGSKGMREIGAVYFAESPHLFVRQASLFNEYDVVIFIPESAPTRLLPFTP